MDFDEIEDLVGWNLSFGISVKETLEDIGEKELINRLGKFMPKNQVSDDCALIKTKNDEFNFKELSLGMSNDYTDALNYQTTFIRVGTKIFGKRNQVLKLCAFLQNVFFHNQSCSSTHIGH